MNLSKDDAASVSVIIPVHNEEPNIKPLYLELEMVLNKLSPEVQVIFVDDGSQDNSWLAILELIRKDIRIHGIRLRCRCGKSAALNAGFRNSSGKYVVTLDGDLQDDPAEIVKLLETAKGGYDFVCGWKQNRLDAWYKVQSSRLFNTVVNCAYGLKLHDHNCGLKCFRADVTQEIRLFGELHRFMTVLAYCKGFRVTEIAVRHRARLHGQSKYGIFKVIEGMLDLFTVRVLTLFMDRPFHLLGTIGGALMLLGFMGLAYLAIFWLVGLGGIGTRPLLSYSAVSVLFGMQLMAVGILAELINWKLSERKVKTEKMVHLTNIMDVVPTKTDAGEKIAD